MVDNRQPVDYSLSRKELRMAKKKFHDNRIVTNAVEIVFSLIEHESQHKSQEEYKFILDEA